MRPFIHHSLIPDLRRLLHAADPPPPQQQQLHRRDEDDHHHRLPPPDVVFLLPEQAGGTESSSANGDADGPVVRLPAHRCVLAARSDKFAAMFEGGFSEGSSGVVASASCAAPVQEVALPQWSAGAFRAFLAYAYTGEGPPLNPPAVGEAGGQGREEEGGGADDAVGDGDDDDDEHAIAELLLLADECLAEGLRLRCAHALGRRLLRRRGTTRGLASLEGALGLVGALHLPTLRVYCRRAVREWPAFWNPTRPAALRLLREALGADDGGGDEGNGEGRDEEEEERALLEDSPALPAGDARGWLLRAATITTTTADDDAAEAPDAGDAGAERANEEVEESKEGHSLLLPTLRSKMASTGLTWAELDLILLGGPRQTATSVDGTAGKLRRWLTTEEEGALRAVGRALCGRGPTRGRRGGGSGGLGLPVPPTGEALRGDLGRLLREGKCLHVLSCGDLSIIKTHT